MDGDTRALGNEVKGTMHQQFSLHPEFRLDRREASQATPRGLSMQALLIATGYISIALTLLIIALNARHTLVTEFFGSGELASLDTEIGKGHSSSKSAFLDKMSAPQRQYISGQVQYIADLIRRSSKFKKASDNDKRLARAIVLESLRANYDPLFIAAVIKSESTFNRFAVSSQGAQGLMQLLPETGEYISRRVSVRWQGSSKLHDAEYNIRLGIAYLKYLEDKFGGNRERALIAYNWGPGNLWLALRNQKTVPAQPKKYARKILEHHESFKRELELRVATLQPHDKLSVVS